jgi:GMP reductase
MTKIIEDVKLDFQDVLLMPKRSTLSSRSEVSLIREYKFKHSPLSYSGVPIIAANMDVTGTFAMAEEFDKHQMSVALHKFYVVRGQLDEFFKMPSSGNTFYTMGITQQDLEKFELLWNRLDVGMRPTKICIDVANGYSRKFVNFVETMREKYPKLVIMAGNVVTPDMVYDLLERGADIVKTGIGSGATCITRKMTGIGYPQLSAILECADAAHGANGLICSDGGITCPGDIAKAFAAGADFVMCGSMFAGHDECEGEIIYNGDIPVAMKFYGMSSTEAMDKHYGGKANYRASEGKIVEIPYKGPVINIIEEMLGGLRSACTYVGAHQLKHLPKCATFVKVNRVLNNSLSQFDVK